MGIIQLKWIKCIIIYWLRHQDSKKNLEIIKQMFQGLVFLLINDN